MSLFCNSLIQNKISINLRYYTCFSNSKKFIEYSFHLLLNAS